MWTHPFSSSEQREHNPLPCSLFTSAVALDSEKHIWEGIVFDLGGAYYTAGVWSR